MTSLRTDRLRSIGPEVTSLKQLGPRKRLHEVETIFLDHNSLRKVPCSLQTIRAPDISVDSSSQSKRCGLYASCIWITTTSRRSVVLYLGICSDSPCQIDGANPMLSQLETLSLTSNRISSILNMAGFKRLRVLRLGNNRLTSLKGLVGGATSNT